MTVELSNQEVAKVFAMYLGCEILMEAEQNSSEPNIDTLQSVNISGAFWSSDQGNDEGQYFEFCKLLLTPLEKISDEDAIQVAKINTSNSDYWTVEDGRDTVINDIAFVNYEIYQFLISRSYAVPIWLGIDHPANGKDAITLGIAIDKTINK